MALAIRVSTGISSEASIEQFAGMSTLVIMTARYRRLVPMTGKPDTHMEGLPGLTSLGIGDRKTREGNTDKSILCVRMKVSDWF